MVNWNKYPFVRLLIPFALGIWTCLSLSIRPHFVTLYAIMLTLLIAAALTSRYIKAYNKAWTFGSILTIYLFISGYAMTMVNEEHNKASCFRSKETLAKSYIARIYDVPEEKEKNIKVTLDIERVLLNDNSNNSAKTTGKVIAYLPKNENALELRYGDMICFNKSIDELSGPRNPNEFDYSGYLNRKGVIGNVFLKDGEWAQLNENKANPIFAFAYRFRDIMLTSLKESGINGKEFGVAAAILLGYNDELSTELRQSYVTAGSMHILCVSGMHVGIIFLMASFLLAFLDRKKWSKRLKQILLLALIWFYALIAGLSPSITRASIMISLGIIGNILNRKGFTINSIAASAFILLCLNPCNLFDIGFLLSYSAVVGIVVLQKPIYNLLFFKNKQLDKIWEMESVALAAQIATMPFTLFYFNQFTTYFWLSNIFMTPISFIVVLAGMTLIMVSWIPYINIAIGYVVWSTLYVMNLIVTWIENLPLSIIRGLYINELEFILLIIFVLATLFLTQIRTKPIFYTMLISCAIFVCSISIRHSHSSQTEQIDFYSLRKHTAIDIINNGQHIVIADSTLTNDPQTINYSLMPNWYRLSLSNEPQIVGLDEDYDTQLSSKRSNIITANNKVIVLANPDITLSKPSRTKIGADYLLIRGYNNVDLDTYANLYDIKHLVIDGTTPAHIANKLSTQADTMGIPYVCLRDKAFVCKLE